MAVAGVLGLVAGALATSRIDGLGGLGPLDDRCPSSAAFRVIAAPDIAPLLRAGVEGSGLAEAGCRITVSAQSSAPTLEWIRENGAAGIDVWIPDSSFWLGQDGAGGSDGFTAQGPPLATSPLVFAATPRTSAALGTAENRPGWATVLDRLSRGAGPKLSVPDPEKTTEGFLSVLAVHAVQSGGGTDPGIALMRALALRQRLAPVSGTADTLLRQAADARREEDVQAALGLFPASERAVADYRRRSPAVPLEAIEPVDVPLDFDYPFAVSPAARRDGDRAAIARSLLSALRAPDVRTALEHEGFRTQCASPAPASPAPASPVPATPVPVPGDRPCPEPGPLPPAEASELVRTWAGYRPFPFRVLVLVDGSGSMNERVRLRSGAVVSKAELLRTAGPTAVRLFGTDTDAGLWLVSTRQPALPFAEVVPIGPIDGPLRGRSRRQVMGAVAAGYQAVPGSGTPLYESVLRASATMRARYRNGAFNLIVVLTDGRDRDSRFAIGRDQFLTRLAASQDPRRPVPVFAVGYGADADMATLTGMAKVTGGRAIPSADPEDLARSIAQVFVAAHDRATA